MMIISTMIITLALVWLGSETNWMRVRLLCGTYTPITEQPGRKWQFAKYGDDALLCCSNKFCSNYHCPRCKWGSEYAWRIPARTVKILYPITRPKGGTRSVVSTINFKAGCNLYRAKLLEDIVKAQKSKALPGYHKNTGSYDNRWLGDCEPSIELLVDGKPIANINGDYKRGMIKDALKPYTSKARVGKKIVTWDFGEADRIAP